MAYKNNKNYGNRNYAKNNFKRSKSKYTKTEKLAFNMGVQDRIRDSISKDRNTRVYISYKNGLCGPEKFDKNKKPLI